MIAAAELGKRPAGEKKTGPTCKDEEELLGGWVRVRRCLVPRLEYFEAEGEGNAVCHWVKHQRQPVCLVGQAIRGQILQALLLHCCWF